MNEEKLKKLESESIQSLSGAESLDVLEELRVRFLGRKSELTVLLKGLKDLSPEERPKAGAALNIFRQKLEALINEKNAELSKKKLDNKAKLEALDVTLPATTIIRGKAHPISQVLKEIVDIFKSFGYVSEIGPDIESDYNNFEALNIPKNHPSREMQATFYINEGQSLLRTHTSPVQIRVMKTQKPPLSVVAPGRVYRCDADVTHSPVFHQVEGFLVDKNITFTDLKGTLTGFLHRFFGKAKRVRFRPSFFPFTEPSAEIDVECIMCDGAGCRVCKDSGWLEVLGAGMIDPNVFSSVGYDPEVYSGFAFGMGVERLAMLKFGIDDIRLFFQNDLRFLRQF